MTQMNSFNGRIQLFIRKLNITYFNKYDHELTKDKTLKKVILHNIIAKEFKV